jgi:asparagine synthase (glutamine-hydrolysing)
MWALVVGDKGAVGRVEIDAMASSLHGGVRAPVIWQDDLQRSALAVGLLGTLPEDVFDRQPLVQDDWVMIAQARIDNRDEILDRLAVPRERRAKMADAEILGAAYRKYAGDCMQYLTGDYAFAVWRRDSGELFAAVDHAGSARLYYAFAGRKLVLSTQLGALLSHRGVSRELDQTALGLLAAPKIDIGSTPYKNIRFLLGGHVIRYRNSVEVSRWWRPSTAPLRYRSASDYVAAAQEKFDSAVAAHLRSTSDIAVSMSGGLDSTLVGATAAAQLKDSNAVIHAYTSIPEPGMRCVREPNWDADDWPFASQVAALYGNMKHTPIPPGGRSPLDAIEDVHARSHSPVRNVANLMWMAGIAEAMLAGGQRVLLCGEKGNFTISPFARRLADGSLWCARPDQAVRLARRQFVRGHPPAWRTLFAVATPLALLDVLRGLIGGLPAERAGTVMLTPAFRREHAASLAVRAAVPGIGGFHAGAMAPMRNWSPDTIAQWGIEVRDPTADRHLIECVLQFPWWALLTDGRSRGLARAMAKGRVPEGVRLRVKRGRQVPEILAIIAGHRQNYLAAIDRCAVNSDFQALFDVEQIRSRLETVCSAEGTLSDAFTFDAIIGVGLFMMGAQR